MTEFWATRPYFLAGLVGYSDGAMRLLARDLGCPFCVTESLASDTLIRGGKGRSRIDPDRWLEGIESGSRNEPLFDNLSAGAADHPLAAQVIGRDPETMARAAALLAEFPFEVIDVNLACPSKKNRGSSCHGGNLLAEPELAIDVLKAVREAVPAERLTSVKMRRAFDEGPELARHFDRIFDQAYELGYRWVTVHARTVEQRYEGKARWPFLAELKRRYPERTVFGSGDVWSAEDIFRMIDATGVSAVAVARGAIGNPWIFRQAEEILRGENASDPTSVDIAKYLRRFAALARRLQGESMGLRRMRKAAIKLSSWATEPIETRQRFVGCKSAADFDEAVSSSFWEASDGASPGPLS